MERLIKRVQSELKIKKIDLHPIKLCYLMQTIFKKYKKEVTVQRGYINMEAFGNPVCFTYFWLEDAKGTQIDILKIDENELSYFFTDHIPGGSRCIDEDMQEIDNLWGKEIDWKEEEARIVYQQHPKKNLYKL